MCILLSNPVEDKNTKKHVDAYCDKERTAVFNWNLYFDVDLSSLLF